MKVNYLIFLTFIIISFIPTFKFSIENEDLEREDTIYIKSNINELFATTELTQYFINLLNNPIELMISFPIKEEISLSKFTIKIGKKIVSSKVMIKEEAEEKYDNSIYSGNTGFLGEYDDNKGIRYTINIGNINPKEKVTLKAFYIQNIGTHDMSYEFVIMEKYPTFHYKELNKNELRNKIIKANFIIKTQSKITRLIAPFFDEIAKKKSTYEVNFNDNYKVAEIKYIKNPDDQQNKDIIDERYGEKYGFPGKINAPTFFTSFTILFRTANINKPILYYQFNPELNETSYSINYIYSSRNIPIPEIPDQDNKILYNSKYENSAFNETPALFIFLIDQSGSMKGESIDLVRKALLLFIKSLPPGSYFQLIGFGSDFKKYNEEPVEYNQKNIENIIDIINNLEADMRGTNLNSPLQSIYSDISYSKINLSKFIFLLTDGYVNDRNGCVDLITENSNKFSVYAFGIGKNFDRIFINRVGNLGKGSSFDIEDIKEINSFIIEALKECVRPYLIDIHFNFLNYQNNIKNSIISCEPNNISNQEDIINFSFILNKENNIKEKFEESLLIEISGKNPNNLMKKNISFNKNENIIRLSNGGELSKMIVGKALKNNKELIDNVKKEIEFSIKYQILSGNTALYAEIINDYNEINNNKLISVNLNIYSIEYILNSLELLSKSTTSFGSFIYSSYGGVGEVMESNSNLSIESKEDCIDDKIKKENENKFNNNDITKLIMSQNSTEGYWEENEETKKIINIIDKDKINKILNKIRSLNKGEENVNKIQYTILVIYYLNSEYSHKINEYILILNKAKKYLLNKGIEYEDFIKGI